MTTIDQYIPAIRYRDFAKNQVYYTRTVAPTVEPLTLDEAMRQLQVGAGEDNAYIQTLIAVARDVAERATGRAMLTQTWLATSPDWPVCGLLPLSVAPVATVSSVRYYADGETSLTTLDPSNYVVSTGTSPTVIVFDQDFDKPDLAKRPDAVQVTFVAGNTTASAVDPSLKHAVRILLRHYYDNPEAAATGNFSELPFSLRHLLESHRASGWVA